MTQNEKYIIANTGGITGNTADYTLDLDTGVVSYDLDLRAQVGSGWFAIKKSVVQSGSYQVSLVQLQSSNLKAPGGKVDIQNLHFVVQHVDGNIATVGVTMDGQNVSGTAQIDISQPVIKLVSLQATAKLFLCTFNLQLTRA